MTVETKAGRTRANFGRMVRAVAPVAPPCFDDRSTWISYCESAAAEQREEHQPGPLLFTDRGVRVRVIPIVDESRPRAQPPLLIERGRVVRFNPDFDFCEECRPEWRREKNRRGHCNPRYLRDLLPPKESDL